MRIPVDTVWKRIYNLVMIEKKKNERIIRV